MSGYSCYRDADNYNKLKNINNIKIDVECPQPKPKLQPKPKKNINKLININNIDITIDGHKVTKKEW